MTAEPDVPASEASLLAQLCDMLDSLAESMDADANRETRVKLHRTAEARADTIRRMRSHAGQVRILARVARRAEQEEAP